MTISFLPETQVGTYTIEAEIGRGGMGIVYRALDPALNRSVALKTLAPHLGRDPDALGRFHQEATVVAGLKHANIATIYGFGEHDDTPYIAMEWIEGQTLKQRLASKNKLPLDAGLNLFRQLASALMYAHQQGVVHRDLKPANIIVDDDDHVTIVDFGLAWFDSVPSLTASGSIVGTPRYMTPEQLQGETVDPRTDQYALALIFYEMLTGQLPFNSESGAALYHQQLYAIPALITELNPTVPLAVENALEKALQKKPSDRFETIEAFARAVNDPNSLQQQNLIQTGLLKYVRSILLILVIVGLVFAGYRIGADAILISDRALPPSPTIPVTPWVSQTPNVPTDSEQLTIGNPDELWPTAIGGPLHNRKFEPPLLPLSSQPRWEFSMPDAEIVALVGGNGHVMAVSLDGAIKVLDWQTGEVLGDTQLDGKITALPTVYADNDMALTLLGSETGSLYALNLADAKQVWHLSNFASDNIIYLTAIPYQHQVFALSQRGQLQVIDPIDGQIKITTDLSTNVNTAIFPPAQTEAGVALMGETGQLGIWASNINSLTWAIPINGKVTAPPLGEGGWDFVTVGLEDGTVEAIWTATGQSDWQEQMSGPVIALAADLTNLYAVTANGEILARSFWDEAVVWRLDLVTPITAGPLVDNEQVILGTEDGEVLFIDAEEGTLLTDQTLTVDAPIVALMPAGGILLVGTDTNILAYGPEVTK